jgi:hypothetical protein
MVTSGSDQASARPSEGVLYQLEKSGLMTNEYVRLLVSLGLPVPVTVVNIAVVAGADGERSHQVVFSFCFTRPIRSFGSLYLVI